jgi:hypothetical protein
MKKQPPSTINAEGTLRNAAVPPPIAIAAINRPSPQNIETNRIAIAPPETLEIGTTRECYRKNAVTSRL